MILYSGSFNPITKGHISVINSLLKNYDENILLCPMGDFYPKKDMCKLKDRINMIKNNINNHVVDKDKIIIMDNINDVFNLHNYSLYNLATYVKNKYKDDIKIVIGMDNLENLKTWKYNINILNDFKLLVMPRDGYKFKNIINSNNMLKLYFNKGNIELCYVDLTMTASSNFRNNLKNKNIDKLGEDCYNETIEYVLKNNLYRWRI